MKKIGILALFITLITSCTKQLDQSPITSKELSVFLKTEIEVEEYVNATYATLQFGSLYGVYLPAMAEIASDNTYDEVPANDAAIYGDMDEFKTVPANTLIADVWKNSYVAIQRCNVVLGRIDAVNFASPDTKAARTGEMKFIRALMYFNLIRFFGDVPLVTEETVDPNIFFGQGRTATTKVYAQIIKDLIEAADILPASTSQQGRVVKTAAQSLLGKVYLTQKDYPNAKTQLDFVINSAVYTLQPNTNDIFSLDKENNKEIIFAVQFASGTNGNSEGSTMYQQFSPSGTVNGAKGHNLPTKELYSLYTADDKRKTTYVDVTGNGVPFSNKLKKPTTITDGGSNFVVLRYADVLLMQAEIENELNNTSVATTLLNSIRNRAGLPNTIVTTQDELRAAIAFERRLELVGEGHRWFDLLRTGEAITVMNAWFLSQGKPITVTEKNLLFPIPQNQINTDPTIKQNPGYQ